MRRREFIKGIGGTAASLPARSWLGATALGTSAQLAASVQVAAQSPSGLPVDIVPQFGHAGSIMSVAFSANGRLIVSGSLDRTIKIWDAASERLIRSWVAHAGIVTSVVFSADSLRVLSGGSDKTAKLWDAATGQLIRTFENPGEVSSVALSPDGTRALAAIWKSSPTAANAPVTSSATLKLGDTASGRLIRNLDGHSETVLAVAFSPDGTRMLSGSGDKTVKLWDAATGRLIRTFVGHSSEVTAVAFSPNGATILSGDETALNLWDVASGRLIRSFEGKSGYAMVALGEGATALSGKSVAFSPDGARVAANGQGQDNSVKIWDAATGRLVRSFPGDEAEIFTIAFSRDGAQLVAGGQRGILKLWNPANGSLIRLYETRPGGFGPVVFSRDGGRLISANGNALKLWNAANGQPIRDFAGHAEGVSAVALSSDGGRVVSGGGDKTVKLWDAESGRLIRSLVIEGDYSPYAVAFSPDGTRVFAGAPGRSTQSPGFGHSQQQMTVLKIWDAANGRLVRTFEWQHGWVNSVALSPDGARMVTGDLFNTAGRVRLWDTANGRQIRSFQGHAGLVGSVAVSRDGSRVASGSEGNTVYIWDAKDGRLVRRIKAHEGWVGEVTFSPDGKRLISGCQQDQTIKLWDVATGRLIRSFENHSGSVGRLTFSPDGARVLSGSGASMKLWQADTGELLTTTVATLDGEWLTITPEGFFDASPKGADLLSAVQGFDIYSIDQFYQQLYRPDVVRQKLSMDLGINARVKAAARNTNLGVILASKAPPDLAIVSPRNDSKTGERAITVEASLADRGRDKGGGIGRIEWRVNDVTRAVQDVQRSADGAVMKVSQKLALPDGTSEIKVVAYNQANLAASLPAAVSVTVNASGPRPRPRLHVLAIGVNDYRDPHIGRLNYAAADARSVAAAFLLSKSDKKIYDDVFVHGPLLNADVTKPKLQAEFRRLGAMVEADDVFVLYVAGHGITDNGRYYFLPHDARTKGGDLDIETGIGQDQLQQWLTLIPAFKSVVIYDTCESGSAAEERSAFRGAQQLVAAEKLSKSMGRTVLSATSDVKDALEGYPPQASQRHGIFTYVLLDAFALADANADGHITTGELAAYLRRHLPDLTEKLSKYRQEPQVKLSGALFTLMARADIAEINKIR